MDADAVLGSQFRGLLACAHPHHGHTPLSGFALQNEECRQGALANHAAVLVGGGVHKGDFRGNKLHCAGFEIDLRDLLAGETAQRRQIGIARQGGGPFVQEVEAGDDVANGFTVGGFAGEGRGGEKKEGAANGFHGMRRMP